MDNTQVYDLPLVKTLGSSVLKAMPCMAVYVLRFNPSYWCTRYMWSSKAEGIHMLAVTNPPIVNSAAFAICMHCMQHVYMLLQMLQAELHIEPIACVMHMYYVLVIRMHHIFRGCNGSM